MVDAMLIVFLCFLYLQASSGQPATRAEPIANCTFASSLYARSSAVANQFQFVNRTSLTLTAEYALFASTATLAAFEIGLIYQFPSISDLVPFPVFLTCAANVLSCQLTTMAGSISQARDSEPITVNLINLNYTSVNSQRSLYLLQGEYRLSNCLLENGAYVTDNQTVFNIQIQYEKAVGTSCLPSAGTCGSPSLTTCSAVSSSCTCLSSDSLVASLNSTFCADTLNRTNCSIFPSRCISWCNSTASSLCQCPDGTLKILRNSLYVCELPVDSSNCSSSDAVRRCPYGQICVNSQCTNELIPSTAAPTSTAATQAPNSTDLNLRIALGVIAGLLGTSVLVLLGVCCWLRYRHRRRAEKSFSPSSSATSSLYISPIQQQGPARSYPTIYHLPVERALRRIPTLHRADSFRQAVLSGHNRNLSVIEHISTRQDSLPYAGEENDSQAYSTVDSTVPSQNVSNHPNIYQVILPPPSPAILTHAV